MEGVSASMYTRIRKYWRRRGYERINGPGWRRRSTVELGGATEGGGRRRRRLWRLRIKPRLRLFKLGSPKKFFAWLRDAYVKMMLGLAKSRMLNSAGYGPYDAPTGDPNADLVGRGRLKEYDQKMIIAIYKSLVRAQDQLAAGDAAKFGPGAAAANNRLAAIAE